MKNETRRATPETAGVREGEKAVAKAPDAAAVEMMQLLDRMEALIPSFSVPDLQRLPHIRTNARFAHELIPPTIIAVEAYEPMRTHRLFDTDAGRYALVYRDELAPVAQRMGALMRALLYSIDQHLATSGAEALMAYQWAKRHAALPDGAGAKLYVEEMQRVVEKTINRRRKPQRQPDAPEAEALLAAPPSDRLEPDEDERLDLLREITKPDRKG